MVAERNGHFEDVSGVRLAEFGGGVVLAQERFAPVTDCASG
jgi:hypothetical protein